MVEAKGFASSEARFNEPIYGFLKKMAEAKGFEPSRLLPAHTISSRAPSTTRPRFHLTFYYKNVIFTTFPQKYVIIKMSPARVMLI